MMNRDIIQEYTMKRDMNQYKLKLQPVKKLMRNLKD